MERQVSKPLTYWQHNQLSVCLVIWSFSRAPLPQFQQSKAETGYLDIRSRKESDIFRRCNCSRGKSTGEVKNVRFHLLKRIWIKYFCDNFWDFGILTNNPRHPSPTLKLGPFAGKAVLACFISRDTYFQCLGSLLALNPSAHWSLLHSLGPSFSHSALR